MLKLEEFGEYNKHPSYRGGDTKMHGRYIWEYAPQHRLANNWGWVAQHRLIGEDIAGRTLYQSKKWGEREVVHHRDENPLNNDPSNLQIMTEKAHRHHHARKHSMEVRAIRHSARSTVIDALAGRSIKNAAVELGIHHMTLRNHYADLVAPRKRKSPTNAANATKEQIAELRLHSANIHLSIRECAKKMQMSTRTVKAICRKYGFPWQRKTRKGELRPRYRGAPTQRWLASQERDGALTEPEKREPSHPHL